MFNGVYSGGGEGRGVERPEDVSDAPLDRDDDPELDFFLLSLGLTIAICGGCEEFSITTCASIGLRTLVGLTEVGRFLL